MKLVHHAERCPANPKLQTFVAWWIAGGPFPITIVYGDRTDAEQAALYAQGRTAPGRIVTNAARAADSAHGHSGAIDCMPVREHNASGGVQLVYLGDEYDEAVRHQAVKRYDVLAQAVRDHGLQSGADFAALHDLPHVQDRDWKTRPLNPGVEP